MERTRIIGIDPGLMNTGVVEFDFYPAIMHVFVKPIAVLGNAGNLVAKQVMPQMANENWACFIEAYRPRSHFDSDARMTELVRSIKRAIPQSQVVDNTGVKKVITVPLMKALNVWDFTIKTHHQDLRSAAYIGLYGMVKDETHNQVLAEFTRDLMDGRAWVVEVL